MPINTNLLYGQIIRICGVLVEMYIEALLADSVLADDVWELWDAGFISDEIVAIAWWLITFQSSHEPTISGDVNQGLHEVSEWHPI